VINFDLDDDTIDRIADAVVRKLSEQNLTRSALIDQGSSPLGNRRHIKLARAHPERCPRVGRKYFVPADLVEAEMQRLSGACNDNDLDEELGLCG